LGSQNYPQSAEVQDKVDLTEYPTAPEAPEPLPWNEVIPHSHSYTAAVTPPTCTEGGYTTYTCTCGDSYVSDYTEANGHSWDGGTVTIQPTEDTEGVRTYTCGCGMTRTESIPRLPVSETKNPFVYDVFFWSNVEKQIRAAKKGDTVTVDATWRTTMPVSIMDAIAETGVKLIIKWNGGEDITIDKPYDGEKQYTIFYLKELADLLAD